MYSLLMKLMILSALVQLGFTLADLKDCHSKPCLRKIEKASHKVLQINWKPISVFPKEAKRFKAKRHRIGGSTFKITLKRELVRYRSGGTSTEAAFSSKFGYEKPNH